ncbi:MAG: hypothetical protein AABY14_01625 [Nanoarchaeota archaeon]
MGWIKDLLSLKEDLDKRALEDIEKIRDNVSSIVSSLNEISKALNLFLNFKRSGKVVNPSLRKNLINRLVSLESKLRDALELEEKVIKEERKEEKRERERKLIEKLQSLCQNFIREVKL